MAEAVEGLPLRRFRGIGAVGTTTSDVVPDDLIVQFKGLPVETNSVLVWASYPAIRTDILPVVDQVPMLNVRFFSSIMACLSTAWLSQLVRFRTHIRAVERTTRSEVTLPSWENPTDDFRDQFYFQLLYELELEPIEDGVSHPIERILQDLISKSSQVGRDWITASFQRLIDEKKDSIAAGLLQCIGRIKSDALETIIEDLVSQGLAHSNAEVRESAISVMEQLEHQSFVSTLGNHQDSVPWLQRYARKVASEIAANRE